MSLLKRCFFLLCLWLPVAAQPAMQTVEGRIQRVTLGLDSCAVEVKTPRGTLKLQRTPNQDDLPTETRLWLKQRLAAPVGKCWPSYTDVGSQVRLVRLLPQPLLVDYRVTQAGPCWLIILASCPQRSQAEQSARKLREAGYAIELIQSDLYPPLRSGYWVCVGGADPTAAGAQQQCQKIRRKGIPDSYVRRIH